MFSPARLLVALATLLVTATAPAQAPDGEVARLFREGNAAYERNDFATARDAFTKAFELAGGQSPKIAANLAVVELDLHEYRSAAEHAAFALEHESDEDMRQAIRANLEEAKKHIGTVRMKRSQCHFGEAISVDGVGGKVHSLCPPPLDELYLDPGRHTIHVRGYEPQAVTVEKGQTVHLDLLVQYTDLITEPRNDVEAPPPPAVNSLDLPLFPAIVGGAVGIAALAVGGGLRVLGSSEEERANALRDDLRANGGHCPPNRCEELLDRYGSADSAYNAGLGLLIGGGVLSAGAIAYAVAYAAQGAPSPELAVELGPGHAVVGFNLPLP